MTNIYLTPSFIESRRQQYAEKGVTDGDLAEYISTKVPEFSTKYSALKQQYGDNPELATRFLDYNAYGTDSPVERYIPQQETAGVPEQQQEGFDFFGTAKNAAKSALPIGLQTGVKNAQGLIQSDLGQEAGQSLDQFTDFMSTPFSSALGGGAELLGQVTGSEGLEERGRAFQEKAFRDIPQNFEGFTDVMRFVGPVSVGIGTAPVSGPVVSMAGLPAAGKAIAASGAAGFTASAAENIGDIGAGDEEMTMDMVFKQAAKEGAIDATIDALFLGAASAYKIGKPVLHARRLRKASQGTKDVAAEIVQGKTKDINAATKALSELDVSDINTYDDLHDAIKTQIVAKAGVQDDVFDAFTETRLLDDFSKTVGKGKNKITDNVVSRSLDNLEELYTKSARFEDVARIQDLRDTAMSEGLTVKQINRIAREYGSDFRTFSKGGEPLTSVNAAMHETTRTALKNTARDMVPDSTVVKSMDEAMSNLYRTEANVAKMKEAVNKLGQRIKKRTVMEKLGRAIFNTIDAATGRLTSGFIQAGFPRGQGLKTLNALELEDLLSKNLTKLQKLDNLATSLDDTVRLEQAALRLARELEQQAAQSKSLARSFPNLTPEEIQRLTPEERLTGLIGGGGDDAAIATTNIQGDSVELLLAKKATKTEMSNGSMRQRVMANLPEKEGYDVVYKGFPKEDAGFYYTRNLDDVPLSQLSPQGVEDAARGQQILDAGGSIDDAARAGGRVDADGIFSKWSFEGGDSKDAFVRHIAYPSGSVGEKLDMLGGLFKKGDLPDNANELFKKMYNPTPQEISMGKTYGINLPDADEAFDTLKKNPDFYKQATSNLDNTPSFSSPAKVGKTADLTSSIQKAKASGQSFDDLLEEARKYDNVDDFISAVKPNNPYRKLVDDIDAKLREISIKKGHKSTLDVPREITSLPEYQELIKQREPLVRAMQTVNKSLSKKRIKLDAKTSQEIRQGIIDDEQLIEIYNMSFNNPS